jgi:hypothetical protein
MKMVCKCNRCGIWKGRLNDFLSKEILNELIGLAMINPVFCEKLLANPEKAALDQGFPLTSEEQTGLAQIQADTIYEFSRQVLEKLMPDG